MNYDQSFDELASGRITTEQFIANKKRLLAEGNCLGCEKPCRKVENNPTGTDQLCRCCQEVTD